MTAAQLTQRLLEQVGEIVQPGEIPTYYNSTAALDALNVAQRLFCLLTLCLETTGTLVVSSSTNWYKALTTFNDWLTPLRIRRESDGVKLEPARLSDLDALDPAWQAATGTVERYACLGFDLIATYRKPASGTVNLTCTYAKSPAVMTSGSPEIPEEYHACLVDGALPILRAMEGAQELAKVLDRFDRFMAAAAKLGAYVRQRNLGLRYDRVPFELETFDRSKLVKLAIKRVAAPMLEEVAMAAKG